MDQLLPYFGAIAALCAAAGGIYATVVARRTGERSATREETQQALEAQSGLLDRYEKRIAHLELRITELETSVEQLAAERNELRLTNRQLERDLEEANLKLEGRLP